MARFGGIESSHYPVSVFVVFLLSYFTLSSHPERILFRKDSMIFVSNERGLLLTTSESDLFQIVSLLYTENSK